MNSNKNKISKIASNSTPDWMNDIDYGQNDLWMDYSSEIARRIYALIKDNRKLNQEKLANSIGAKPQYISRILRGKENLTLKTIYKLSKALHFELITFPPYEYSQPISDLLKPPIWQMEINANEQPKVVEMYSYKNFKVN